MLQHTGTVAFDPSHELALTPQGGTVSKAQRHRWAFVDEPGHFSLIDKKDLMVDRAYQRESQNVKVLEIAREWSWVSCGCICVVKRQNGAFYVIDGQHRVMAAWKRVDITFLPCMVYPSGGLAHEASAFISANTNRKPVSAYSKFKAKLVAGDELATAVCSIVQEHGFEFRPDGNIPGTLACVTACLTMAKNRGLAEFRQVFEVAAMLARSEDANITETLLGGLSVLDMKVSNGLRNQRLLDRICQVGAKSLVDGAKKMSFRVGKGGAYVWADGMLEMLNRGLRYKIGYES